jgi:hypothetical protein
LKKPPQPPELDSIAIQADGCRRFLSLESWPRSPSRGAFSLCGAPWALPSSTEAPDRPRRGNAPRLAASIMLHSNRHRCPNLGQPAVTFPPCYRSGLKLAPLEEAYVWGAYHGQICHRRFAGVLHVRVRYRDRDRCRKLSHLASWGWMTCLGSTPTGWTFGCSDRLLSCSRGLLL